MGSELNSFFQIINDMVRNGKDNISDQNHQSPQQTVNPLPQSPGVPTMHTSMNYFIKLGSHLSIFLIL